MSFISVPAARIIAAARQTSPTAYPRVSAAGKSTGRALLIEKAAVSAEPRLMSTVKATVGNVSGDQLALFGVIAAIGASSSLTQATIVQQALALAQQIIAQISVNRANSADRNLSALQTYLRG